MLHNWSLRRVAFWVVIITVASYIIAHPATAGNKAANAFDTARDWGQSALTAGFTFVSNVTA